jgi:hypothetical protein
MTNGGAPVGVGMTAARAADAGEPAAAFTEKRPPRLEGR